ncbi:MAG: hypothetical protein JXC33_02985 [Deltaproteobacteria bacterium]|nr:hypothetical protein [Deltaproteobacteria bacterium]
MKTCKRCFREIEEPEVNVVDISSAADPADSVLQGIDIEDVNNLCPECREELGVMTLTLHRV